MPSAVVPQPTTDRNKIPRAEVCIGFYTVVALLILLPVLLYRSFLANCDVQYVTYYVKISPVRHRLLAPGELNAEGL